MKTWCVLLGVLFGAACGGGESPSACTGPDCACWAGTAEWCGGTCVDVTSDPANCGSCGQDCLGAPCVDGVCWPETLAVVPNAPAAITLDGDDIVFATTAWTSSSGAVYRVPKTGGELEVLYRGLGSSPALAVTTGAILVADSGQIEGCRPRSSAGTILAINGGETALYSMGRRCAQWMLSTEDGLTWAEGVRTAYLPGWAEPEPGPWIARLPEGSLPDEPPTELSGRRDHGFRELVQSGQTLLWHERRPPSIFQMPVAGGAASPIASAPSGAMIEAHAADAERLVYADSSGRVVLRSLVTGNEVTVATSTGGVQRIAMDASFVYWINASFDGGGVWVVDLRSSQRRQLAGGTAQALTQDDRFVYALRSIEHAERIRTEVVRVRKPASIGPSGSTPSHECRAPLARCASEFGDFCVEVATNPNHCGDCMTVCRAGELCVGGRCVCAPTSLVCGGNCVDPATDKANCGRCGRSCAGGDCSGGDCMPVRIDGLAYIAIAVQDANALYYAKGDVVSRLDKQSLGVTTIANVFSPLSLAVDATRLYITTSLGQIWSRAKDGSGSTQLLYRVSGGARDPRQSAVVGDTVLWVEYATDFHGPPVKLVHAASNGSGIRGTFLPQDLYPGGQDDESRDVAIADSVIYWLLGDSVERRGTILRIDLAAALPAATVVATLDHDPAALAVAGGRLYVTTRGSDGVLLSLPTTGGPITLHAQGLADAGPIKIAPDGGIYWIDGYSGWINGDSIPRMIRHLAPGSVAPRVVQKIPQGFTTFIVDEDRLYTLSYDFHGGIFVMTR